MDVTGPARAGVARAIDGLLEVSVAGGFGSPGIRLRRRIFDWEQLPRMDGRRVVITGATSGIGRAAAAEMAGLGADVAIVGRDHERTQVAATQIAAGTKRAVRAYIADLNVMTDARRVADEIAGDFEALDVLIHNAGALSAQYERTAEGYEATYASQVLSQHVLTSRLLPLLSKGTDPRVIIVSSGGMYAEALDPGTVQMSADAYDGVRAYARAKRAQVALNQEWARRLPGHPVAFHAMHPGWADTRGVQDSLPSFRRITRPILRTPQEGADTIVWLAGVRPIPAPSGTFWSDRMPRGTVRVPGTGSDSAAPSALWAMVCAQTGERPDEA